MNRYFARKTGITRLFVVIDSATGKSVFRTSTYTAAARRATKMNEKLS